MSFRHDRVREVMGFYFSTSKRYVEKNRLSRNEFENSGCLTRYEGRTQWDVSILGVKTAFGDQYC